MPKKITEAQLRHLMLHPNSIKLAALEDCNFCRITYSCPNFYDCQNIFGSVALTINAITLLRNILWQVCFISLPIELFINNIYRVIKLV